MPCNAMVVLSIRSVKMEAAITTNNSFQLWNFRLNNFELKTFGIVKFVKIYLPTWTFKRLAPSTLTCWSLPPPPPPPQQPLPHQHSRTPSTLPTLCNKLLADWDEGCNIHTFLCGWEFVLLSSRFDKRKGFYCQVTSQGGTHCLGKGKGRHYAPIDERSQRFLEEYYQKPNKELADLLQLLKKPLPNWLRPNRWKIQLPFPSSRAAPVGLEIGVKKSLFFIISRPWNIGREAILTSWLLCRCARPTAVLLIIWMNDRT